MRSMEETTVLITVATDGLGRGVAERLASDGATVLLHGRDRGRLDEAEREIRRASGNERIRTYLADFAALKTCAPSRTKCSPEKRGCTS